MFLELSLRIISPLSGTLAETVFFSGRNFCLLDAGCFELTISNVFFIWFQLFGWLFCKVHPGAVVFAVLAAMSIQGSANLQTQWNIVGEFSNLPQEELIEWIKYSTKPGRFSQQCYIPLQNLKPTLLLLTLLFLSRAASRLFRKREMSILLKWFAKEMLYFLSNLFCFFP